MPKVLIVEDDRDLSDVLDFNLRKEGFDTAIALSGARALACLRDSPPDLVVLDLMLPDISGLEVCRSLRADPELRHTPVMVVTARSNESDRLEGLECGADDYIVKPFSVRELVLRIKAVLRRTGQTSSSALALECGAIVVDNAAHRVFVLTREVSLTRTEYQLLSLFMTRPGRVFSRQQLLDQIWHLNGSAETRTVDTHIRRLREKLGRAGTQLETVRSVGYRLVDLPKRT